MPVNSENFETELRAALRRAPSPEDFARRLKKRLPIPIWRRPITLAMAAGLLLAALIPPGVMEYRHREELRAIEAGRQVSYALRLTSMKLRETRERVQRATKQKS
jgi:hypothetical protein